MSNPFKDDEENLMACNDYEDDKDEGDSPFNVTEEDTIAFLEAEQAAQQTSDD